MTACGFPRVRVVTSSVRTVVFVLRAAALEGTPIAIPAKRRTAATRSRMSQVSTFRLVLPPGTGTFALARTLGRSKAA